MNSGDIQFEHIKESEFKQYAPDHREWLLFKGVRSLSFTCHARPGVCDRKYVSVRHVVVAGAVICGFLVGIGFLHAQVILPELVRQAVSGVLPLP